MRSPDHPRVLTAVTCSLFFLLMSCGDDDSGGNNTTGPTGPSQFDSRAALVTGMADDFFVENEAVTALNTLGPAMANIGFKMSPLVLKGPGAGAVIADIPQELKGSVWVLQEGSLQYIEDTGQVGPAAGVRFILYAIDGVLLVPESPLRSIGHVDVVEATAPPNPDLDLDVVLNGSPAADLTVQATVDGVNLDVQITGTLSNGSEDLDVWLPIDGSIADPLNFTAPVRLTTAATELTSAMTISNTLASPNVVASTSILIQNVGTMTFYNEYETAGGVVDGSFFPGTPYPAVFFSGSQDNVTFTNTETGNLTASDLAVVENMFNALDAMIDGSVGIVGLIFAVMGFAFLTG